MLKKVLILILSMQFCLQSFGQKTEGNVWIVSVGIGVYQHDDILTRLDFTVESAYEFTRVFELRQLIIAKSPVLTNAKARRINIINTLQKTFVDNPEVSKEDMILFYFSGHGEVVGGRVGICPYDYSGSIRDLISDQEIQRIMNRSKAKHKVCFIEACKTEVQTAAILEPEILNQFNTRRESIQGGLVYMTSTKVGKKSYGKPQIGGYFSHYLLKGLSGEANTNDDAYITISELFPFVQNGVSKLTRGRQVPQINTQAQYNSMPIMVIPSKLNISPKGSPLRDERRIKDDLAQAEQYYDDDNYKRAFELYFPHRNSVHFTASHQVHLGYMYSKGYGGLAADKAEAVKWYRKAAEQGYALGQANLGIMYENGYGDLPRDKREAVKWYRKAAEQGNAFGQKCLAVMYDNGYGGLTKDRREAVKWYRKAAEQGNASAQANLGIMYENGYGGLVKDKKEAVKWYRKAAEQGDAFGQKCLGVMYDKGYGGLAVDKREAVKWYRKAAEQGNAAGQVNLGVMYENGYGGLIKDKREAVKWYRKSAEQGNAAGQKCLGVMYDKGYGGLAVDKKEAVRLYRKSAEQGNAAGQVSLGVMYENGEGGLIQDHKEAVRWYHKAAEQGHASGQAYLAEMYESGKGGLTKNKTEAVNLYRKAAKQGNEYAKKALKRLGYKE